METDAASGQRVFHVVSPHALIQASGYLKHVLGKAAPCSVLFRGQSQLYSGLKPGLYRSVTAQRSKSRKDEALAQYLAALKHERKALRAVDEHVREPLLQHYGIRTKWLDLVDNVWVALWFACHEASASGRQKEYLHFERRRARGLVDYAYILLIAADATERIQDQPGVFRGEHTQLVDLRVAAPSHFLRPHAQHAVLLRRAKQLDHLHLDYGEFVAGVLRVLLTDALEWLGDGTLLTTHALFPPAQYDFGYRELLEGAPGGNMHVGTIHYIGA